MLRRSSNKGRRSQGQQKLAFAVAILLAPWLPVANAAAAAQPDHRQQAQPQPRGGYAQRDQQEEGLYDGHQPVIDQEHVARVAVTAVDSAHSSDETPYVIDNKKSSSSRKHQQRAPSADDSGRKGADSHRVPSQKERTQQQNFKNPFNKNDLKHNIPGDASALATLAPAQAVRAPYTSRSRPSSSMSSGITSLHDARSLEDWEVEDFVLMATVDGDLYASDRKTGKVLWHLEVDQPMIETKHHRSDVSILDGDYNPIDHYIWAIEPNRDGGIYVWSPDSDVGLARTAFTMKRIVEELAPFADENPPVVYTGDKKTTLITLDASTGRVLKWFGSSGSHVNEEETCLKGNTLYNMDSTECSSEGTITLGRTEYTVGIQRRDGKPVASLKFAEWVPNNFDNDLYQQYHTSLDSRYITSQHDGKVYAFDYEGGRNTAPKFNQRFDTPVARVFDVCRPWDAPSDSHPELIVLPQPPMPSHDSEIARIRSNSIFLNRTESGSWYAMSGRAYPLIIDAPIAKIAHPDGANILPPMGTGDADGFPKSLIGTHHLDFPNNGGKQTATLPGSYIQGPYEEVENESYLPVLVDEYDPSIIDKVKSLPQDAIQSIWDFISNPTLIVVFLLFLAWNEQSLRRGLVHLRRGDIGFFTAKAQRWFKRTEDIQVRETLNEPVENMPNAENEKPAVKITDPAEPVELAPEAKIEPDSTVPMAGEGTQDVKTATDDAASPETPAEPLENEQGPQPDGLDASPEKKKKKAHRGRRGGVKHRKAKAREDSQQSDDGAQTPQAIEPAIAPPPITEVKVQDYRTDDNKGLGGLVRIGNLVVDMSEQLGTGSNGTIVFAGKYDGRDVAVKRMLIHFYDIAARETKLLRESDDHPNVIRYYSQQETDGFLYIALERCAASLADVVERPHKYPALANAGRADLPTVLYQIANGISHLHDLRIVHRDLKPHNILINIGKNGKPHLLVSDFGLCKKLEDTQSSFGATTGRAAGTTGWRAPELLLDDDADAHDPNRAAALVNNDTHSGSGTVFVQDGNNLVSRRATRSIDIFSLGLVFFYVLTNGGHPFDCGDKYMREVNIRNGKFNLDALDSLGDFAHEAKCLVAFMLEPKPTDRPSAREVMSHPFFWSAKKRLAFLCDVSDHFEKEIRDPPSYDLQELESYAEQVIQGDFLRVLPREFIDSLGKQRKYTGTKLLDLLRALRNKRNHYEDMPESLRRAVGPLPEGYLTFWTTRFPGLLMACWNLVWSLKHETADRFKEYYEPTGM